MVSSVLLLLSLFIGPPVLYAQFYLGGLLPKGAAPASEVHSTLPYPYQQLCGFVRQCGDSLKPPGYTAFIADGTWNPDRGLFYFVEVGGDHYLFSFDPDSCNVLEYVSPPEFATLATRGICYNTNDSTVWTGDWFRRILHFTDLPECDLIQEFDLPYDIAGLAIDQENQHMWAITNDEFDQFFEFDISSGTPILIQGPIDVPWQTEFDGWDGAGLEYDQERHLLIAVNQLWAHEGNYVELFQDLDPAGASGVAPAGYCKMGPPTTFGWGIGYIEGTDEFLTVDLGYETNFPGHIHKLPVQ